MVETQGVTPPLYDDFNKEDASRLRFVMAMMRITERGEFQKASVQDVCDEAGVSRQTFYRSFSSKFDVIKWFWEYNARHCFLRIGDGLTWHDAIALHHRALSPFSAYFSAARTSENALSPDSLASFCIEKIREALESAIVNNAHVNLNEQLRFEIDMFARTFTNAPYSYRVLDGFTDSDRVASYLCDCVPRLLYKTLETENSSDSQRD